MRYYLDTNIFLRYFLGDNQKQFVLAKAFFKDAKQMDLDLVVSIEILLEFEYVLRKVYQIEKAVVLKYLNTIVSNQFIHVHESDVFTVAMSLFEKCNADIVDCVLFARSVKTSSEIFTFDKDFVKIKKVYDTLS